MEEFPSLHNFTFPTSDWCTVRTRRCIQEPNTVVVGESSGSLEEIPRPSKVQLISREASENSELTWNLRKCSVSSFLDASGKAKRKLSLSLSTKEIEADFQLLNGKKPHKRPKKCFKKRPKKVQKQLDDVFPGMWLSILK